MKSLDRATSIVGRANLTESQVAAFFKENHLPRRFTQVPGVEMGRRGKDSSEARFAAYVAGLVGVIGHADRAGPLEDYCTGLMLPADRKSGEPLAAMTAPMRTPAQH
jgi:hypothetical protein